MAPTQNSVLPSIAQAVSIGQLDAVMQLIQEGFDINSEEQPGAYPLLIAASRNDIDMVKLLLRYGALTEVEDLQGKTPLLWAEHHSNSEMIQVLQAASELNSCSPTYRR